MQKEIEEKSRFSKIINEKNDLIMQNEEKLNLLVNELRNVTDQLNKKIDIIYEYFFFKYIILCAKNYYIINKINFF